MRNIAVNLPLSRTERRVLKSYADSGRYIGMESLSSDDAAKICGLKTATASVAVQKLLKLGVLEQDNGHPGSWHFADMEYTIDQEFTARHGQPVYRVVRNQIPHTQCYRLSVAGAGMLLSTQTQGVVQ